MSFASEKSKEKHKKGEFLISKNQMRVTCHSYVPLQLLSVRSIDVIFQLVKRELALKAFRGPLVRWQCKAIPIAISVVGLRSSVHVTAAPNRAPAQETNADGHHSFMLTLAV